MNISLLSLLLLTVSLLSVQAQSPAKYIKTPTGYVMVLRQGDNVLAELEKLTLVEKIPSASFIGFGFVHPTFGFWNAKKKDYEPKAMRDMELASMTGSIAWKDEKPALHVHGVVTGKDFKAFGGHILAMEVGTGSVEITITVHPNQLNRETDQATGAAVLRL
ncbi:DNA-binding protein [Spirosoma daeguense]